VRKKITITKYFVMKKILTSVFLLCCLFYLFPPIAFAQKEANNWYFSTGTGIDFNSGAPVSMNNSAMTAYEGCSVISDKNTGRVLMYSNGLNVWDSTHNIMPNGSGLMGNTGSAQGCIFLPDPGNSNQYYLFTGAEVFSGGIDGYHYSIIDMTLNGGLGNVTATKNVLLFTPGTENLCAVKNSTGTGYWIGTHQYSTNNFVMYELTSSGISAPVLTADGITYSGSFPGGYMKFSPDASRIAIGVCGGNEVQVSDFDPATGIVSNSFLLSPVASNSSTYGVCFSPNSTRLYAEEENTNQLFQYDLTQPTQAAINASKTIVGTTASYAIQDMQLAPDGKMYCNRSGNGYLAVVNDPDSLGTDCNFVDNGFYLSGYSCAYGLPGFPEDIFAVNPASLPQNQIASNDTFLCEKFCINFFDSSTNNPTSWQWYFPGGNPSSSTLQNPSQICYDSPGTYDVTLITNNAFGVDTLTMAGFITVYPTPPFPVITQVGYTLTSTSSNTYQWQFNTTDIPGATNQSYTAMQTGFYTVVVGDSNSCKNSASVYVLISGVDDVSGYANISIYPNPATDGLMVEWLNGFVGDEISISILNALGQEIFSSKQSRSIGISDDGRKEIDLSDLASGVYFIEIESQNIFLKKKIIITK